MQNNQTEIKSQTAILQKLQNQKREILARLEIQKRERQQAISDLI
ncbi:hypothetical protein [Coxiella-like endosymbiont of Rhipicephalus sanguineus]|nr:hypothetical protein [Coxiella-like endosymbiont of Rhipicephalus sanguineus]